MTTPENDKVFLDDGPEWLALLKDHGLLNRCRPFGSMSSSGCDRLLSDVLHKRFCRLNGRRNASDAGADMLHSECWKEWSGENFSTNAVSSAEALCGNCGRGDPACVGDIAAAIILPDRADATLRSTKSASTDIDAAARACGVPTTGPQWIGARARIDILRACATRNTQGADGTSFDRALESYCLREQWPSVLAQLHHTIKSAGADDANALCMLRALEEPPRRDGVP